MPTVSMSSYLIRITYQGKIIRRFRMFIRKNVVESVYMPFNSSLKLYLYHTLLIAAVMLSAPGQVMVEYDK